MVNKVFKMILLTVFLGVIVFAGSQYLTNTPEAVLNSLVKHGRLTKSPQEFRFSVKFLGFIPAGESVINIVSGAADDGKEVYRIFAEAQPAKFIDFFYKVKAKAESIVDKDNLYTLKFTHSLNVAGETKEDKVIFYDQINHVMQREGEKRVILPDTHDPLSAIFYLTRQELAIDKVFDLNINTNQKNYRLYAQVTRKKSIRVENKQFNVYLIKGSINRRDKSPRHSSEFEMWVLDDTVKAPLLINVSTSGLSVIAKAI